MTTTQVLIEGAAPRTVVKRDGSGSITLYEVVIGGRKYVTRKPVFDAALQLIGQPALAELRAEQKGEYTNYYLDGVVGRQPGFDQPQAQTQTQIQPLPVGQITFSQQPAPVEQIFTPAPVFVPAPALTTAPPPGVPTERDLQIWRQCATKVAAVMSTTTHEFWANVDLLLNFYETGQKPTINKSQTDDIPFMPTGDGVL